MYEERLVAFLDILGFKEAINESSISHTRFNEIKSFLQTYSNSNHAKEVFGNFVNGVFSTRILIFLISFISVKE